MKNDMKLIVAAIQEIGIKLDGNARIEWTESDEDATTEITVAMLTRLEPYRHLFPHWDSSESFLNYIINGVKK